MRDDVVHAARGWLGTPYRHQASCKGAGTDCLGLIRGIWRELYGPEPEQVPGYSEDWGEPARDERLWRGAARYLAQQGAPLPAAPGDVLLFRLRERGVAKHLGVASIRGGVPHFIHAYSGQAVIESPLTQPWARRVVARFRFPKKD